MQIIDREYLIEQQPRAYTYGTIEYINEEWIFFDEEDDEAFLFFEEINNNQIEFFINGNWQHGFILIEEKSFFLNNNLFIPHQTMVRFRKRLNHMYEQLLQQLDDQAFIDFIQLLKQGDYSIFDCFFCHNSLEFWQKDWCEGVNIMLFDNQDFVCSVHHYYVRNPDISSNRFELTQTNGMKLFT
ncbi:MAG: DUF2777 family protein [Bacillaceae bacterium]